MTIRAWFFVLLMAPLACEPAAAPLDGRAKIETLIGEPFSDQQWQRTVHMAEVPPLPPDETNAFADDPRAVALGHRLFFEPALSANNAVSCATCHDPTRDFTDGRRVAKGLAETTRNTPSIINAAHHRWLTWDGRVDSLWAQALEPIENNLEMGGDRVSVLRTVAAEPKLARLYEDLFGSLPELPSAESVPAARPIRGDSEPDAASNSWAEFDKAQQQEITRAFVNLGKSFGAYQRQLLSADAPFDRFVAAMQSPNDTPNVPADFPPEALRGLALFTGKAGCWECHAGPMLTTGEFHDTGVPPVAGGMPTDAGRFTGAQVVKNDPFNAAGVWSDAPDGDRAQLIRGLVNSPDNWGRFRTPSLRGVSKTAPYMHEGRFQTLEEVIRFYSTLEGAVQLDHHQESVLQPLDLSDEEVAALVAFLRSLDGTLKNKVLGEHPRSE